MPLNVPQGAPTLFIRKEAWERSGLSRARVDGRLGLTPEEFRVEGDVVAVGPIYEEASVSALIDELETAGLVYFDDFFELSGNWPEWLRVYVSGVRGKA